MKNQILLLVVLVVLAFFNACGKLTPTTLELTLKDNLGNTVSGASVKLYSSQADWINKTNQVGETQISDESGKVKFSDLSNIKYYWFAEKGCQNNVNGSISTTSALIANSNNTVNVILSSTGTLKFLNTSKNPYGVYINGTFALNMNGETTHYKYYMPTGSYSIRVLQLSGYVLYPTEKTYTGTLECGQKQTTVFP